MHTPAPFNYGRQKSSHHIGWFKIDCQLGNVLLQTYLHLTFGLRMKKGFYKSLIYVNVNLSAQGMPAPVQSCLKA